MKVRLPYPECFAKCYRIGDEKVIEDGRLVAGEKATNWIARRLASGEVEVRDGEVIVYPWHLLDLQADVLKEMSPCYDAGQVSPLASVLGVLRLGKGSVVLPGVVIEGHVSIGDDCRIGPNCYIRGTTSIGDGCLIGQGVEIKSSNIGERTFISHLSYVGDSLIGSNVNFGAGSVCSNYRHDGANHRVMLGGELIDSGRDKLGAMIGDDVRLGCNTTIYPARVIRSGARTLPGQVVTKNLE